MTHRIHLGDTSVDVDDNEPFTVLRDRNRHLTGKCKSTDISIGVSDIIAGDTIDIVGRQGLVTNVERL